jgi:hypothetical protein
VDNAHPGNRPAQPEGEPRPAAVTFVTTEHFTLQGSGHSLVAALVAGVLVAGAALTGLMRYQNSAWIRGNSALFPDAEAGEAPH